MNQFQIVLLSVAISLDTLALMIVEGSMYGEINKIDLIKQTLLISIWQTLGFLIGNRAMILLLEKGFKINASQINNLNQWISVTIFLVLGILMIKKSLNKNTIDEKKLEVMSYQQTIKIAITSGIDAFFIGISFVFLQQETKLMALTLLVISVLSVIIGKYIGYWFGYVGKSKAYKLSGIIFFIYAINILLN